MTSEGLRQYEQPTKVNNIEEDKAGRKDAPCPVVDDARIGKGKRLLSIGSMALQLIIAHMGVLQQGEKDHNETGEQVDVDRLEVGYLRKVGYRTGDQCRHGEYRRDAQRHSGVMIVLVEKEGHPRDGHDEKGGDVHLRDIVTDGTGEEKVTLKSGIVPGGVGLDFSEFVEAEQAEGGQVDFRVEGHGRGVVSPVVGQFGCE